MIIWGIFVKVNLSAKTIIDLQVYYFFFLWLIFVLAFKVLLFALWLSRPDLTLFLAHSVVCSVLFHRDHQDKITGQK